MKRLYNAVLTLPCPGRLDSDQTQGKRRMGESESFRQSGYSMLRLFFTIVFNFPP